MAPVGSFHASRHQATVINKGGRLREGVEVRQRKRGEGEKKKKKTEQGEELKNAKAET